MKIKQVGTSHPEEKEELKQEFNSEFTPPAQKQSANSKILLFWGIGFIVVVAFILIYVFVINTPKKDISITSSDSLKLKELELKERELKLKENKLNKTDDKDEKDYIKNIVTSLISEFNAKSTSVDRFYADYANYYTWGSTHKAKILSDKKSFYGRWDYLNMHVDNIYVYREGDLYKCDYDKTIESSNYSNGKNLNMKVKSVLFFQKINNEWLITEERDEKTYYLNKNY